MSAGTAHRIVAIAVDSSDHSEKAFECKYNDFLKLAPEINYIASSTFAFTIQVTKPPACEFIAINLLLFCGQYESKHPVVIYPVVILHLPE